MKNRHNTTDLLEIKVLHLVRELDSRFPFYQMGRLLAK